MGLVAASWALHAVLMMEHMSQLAKTEWKFRFQVVYVRLGLAFPIMSLMAAVGAFLPWTALWMEFAQSLVEAYVLCGFLALLYGFGKLGTRNMGEVFLNSRFASSPCPCADQFESPGYAETWWKVMILQFSVIKPLTTLIPAVVDSQGHPLATSSRQYILLRIIAALSILIAVASILRVHNALAWCQENPYGNYRVFQKVAVMKLLFLFIILNTLIFAPLTASGAIPTQPWVCSADVVAYSAQYAQWCQDRTLQIIFMIEILIMTVPLVLYLRHHQLTQDEETGWPSCGRVAEFLCRLAFPFDLHLMWSGGWGTVAPESSSNAFGGAGMPGNKGAPTATSSNGERGLKAGW